MLKIKRNDPTAASSELFVKKKILLSATAPVKKLLRSRQLHTVCEEARCPNISECLGKPTATFIIMGDRCTRNCPYCMVEPGKPASLNPNEPANLARTVVDLHLRYVVITSVTRDDLPDGGIAHFAACVRAINTELSGIGIELLVPDFRRKWEFLPNLFEEKFSCFNHNIETVEALYKQGFRPGADYRLSLELLKKVKDDYPHLLCKSGIMVGLGERTDQVLHTLDDLAEAGCDIVTIGQYLAPSRRHAPVKEYISEECYTLYREHAEKAGIGHCYTGPFVRSSYNADKIVGLN